MKKLYLIDISSFIFRAYYAIRPLSAKDGTPVNAVFGVISMMQKLIQTHKPDHLIVCYDRPDKGFRHEIFPEYKANRSEPPEDLVPQFELINEFIRTYPIKGVDKKGYEADDVIASLVEKYKNEKDMSIYIVSSDKDLMQLVGENVFMYDTMKDKTLKTEDVKAKFGVLPERVVDVQSLCGDASDNIPGVLGVGPKTASKLINDHGDLEGVLANIDKIKGKLAEKLEAGKKNALLSKKLVTLVRDLDLELDWDTMGLQEPQEQELNEFYTKLGFKRFITSATETRKTVPAVKKARFELIDSINKLEKVVQEIKDSKPKFLAFDTETDALDSLNTQLVGISFCTRKDLAYYVPLNHKEGNNLDIKSVLERLKPVLEDKEIPKVGQNAKFDHNVFSQYGVQVTPIAHDTMLGSYLIDPQSQHNLDFLADKYLGIETIKFKDLVGRGQTFADVDIKLATDYAAEDSWVVYSLVEKIIDELKKNDLNGVYATIEMPLVPVLAKMEQQGVLVDRGFLDELNEEFASRLNILEKDIYSLAGEEFNINSPKQLAVILFEKLELPVIKKTKTGYSTDVDVLSELARQHALPEKLLKYRSLTKLLSTYVVQLKNLINPKTDRVHTNFNQAIVATGRLSSKEPNLQNIPIKTDEGKRIRQAFIAPEGHVLFSVDYSQIELRLLAAFSQDPNLLDAYKKNQDIHSRTASHIFGMSIEEVDSTHRSIGKTINFGVIYGQSAFGLAKQLGVPQKEAKRFIEGFYTEFARVKEYKEEVLNQARENGFVTTHLGRRRYLPEITSRNHLSRQNAERMAFNTVFQGSAADLIKKAMIEIHDKLIKDGLKTKMILQVHDELLFEVPEDELQIVQKFIPEIMEGAFELDVALKVTCNSGKTWAEAH